jgi:AcrR family transcriptional regulator
MPRPSRNVDARLLAAGRDLYADHGAAGLSVRKLAEHAGVNLGMFHYHFGTKDAFLRTLLQSLYEPMFRELTLAAGDGRDARASLRAALQVIARFARDHRRLLRRLVMDASAGESAALDFLRENVPRHLAVIAALVGAGQRQRALKPVPSMQAVTFIAGAVAGPILVGSALVESGIAPTPLAERYEADVLSDAALAERIDLALAGLALPKGGPR